MEAVTIQLTPLGRDERENSRLILLNKDKREVEIGRASKNAQKGLLAASDNAWFDYPILSRTHAKFTVSLPQKTVYVQDCGSTHGTYLQKRKLESGIEYIIRDGEIITFGQPVTSGAVTYPAKDFRVYSNWMSLFREPTTRRSDQAPSASFRVPDDDDASSVVSSREGSVQVLDSHPRSFSVPTTDSESDSEDSEIEYLDRASSVQGVKEAVSTATTTDHGIAAKEPPIVDLEGGSVSIVSDTKARGPHLRGPSIITVLCKPTVAECISTGSSQQNAINIEDEDSHKQDILDIESDDEGPEKLPIQHILPKKDRTINHQENYSPNFSDEASLDPDDQVERAIMQSRALLAREKNKEPETRLSTRIPLDPSTGMSDGFESADDDGFDVDDDFSYDYEGTPTDLKDLLAPVPDMSSKSSKPASSSRPQRPQKTHPEAGIEDPYQFHHICPDVSASNGINVSQAPQKWLPPLKRAPSPSDAALAKISFDVPAGDAASASPNCTTNVDGTLYGNDHSTDSEVLRSGPFTHGYYPTISYPSLLTADTHSKPYSQGPFANQFHGESSPTWLQGNDFVDRAEGRYQEMILNDITADARYAAKLQAEEDAYASAAHPPIDSMVPSASNPKSRSGSEGQSSKINISSLVNASHTDSRPRKRKADDISSIAEAEEALEALELLKNNKFATMQDFRQPQLNPTPNDTDLKETQLPDAQRRDSPPFVETVPFTQDSALAPSIESSSNDTANNPAEIEGPARKKARTSSASTKGIGKFVSGVCVGLVGAVAAFIATIPASVREEALREFGNAA